MVVFMAYWWIVKKLLQFLYFTSKRDLKGLNSKISHIWKVYRIFIFIYELIAPRASGSMSINFPQSLWDSEINSTEWYRENRKENMYFYKINISYICYRYLLYLLYKGICENHYFFSLNSRLLQLLKKKKKITRKKN